MSPDIQPEPRHVPTLRPGPKGGKRDINRRRRTKEICDAGLSLFLQRGIEGVTIDDIVKSASVAKGSFYRYFQDKSDLVAAIFGPYESLIEEAFAACEKAVREADGADEMRAAYRVLAASLAEILTQAPNVLTLYLQENRAPGVGARAPVRRLADKVDRWAVSLTRAAHDNALLRDVDPRVSARSVVGASEKLAHDLLAGSSQELQAVREASAELIDVLMGGLKAA